MTEAPRHVTELAERRAKARAERDFAAADALRGEIERAGWLVEDAPDGFTLSAKPSYEVWPTLQAVPVSAVTDNKPESALNQPQQPPGDARGLKEGTGRGLPTTAPGQPAPIAPAEDLGFGGHPGGDPQDAEQQEAGATGVGTKGVRPSGKEPSPEDMLHAQRVWDGTLAANRLDELGVDHERQRVETADITVSVGLVVDGWPDDLRACVESVIEHTTAHVLAIDLGNLDGSGDALHELVQRHPERITAWHVAEQPHWRGGTAGWGASRTKLMQLDQADVHVLMETSTVLQGDAITPLVAAIKEGAVAAGWKGVEPGSDGTGWHEAGPGPVRGLLGYLMAVRRSAALGAMPEKARYYRNADLELSLALPGELVVPKQILPVRQSRHRGYHEVDEEYRERESRSNYEGVLRMLRSS